MTDQDYRDKSVDSVFAQIMHGVFLSVRGLARIVTTARVRTQVYNAIAMFGYILRPSLLWHRCPTRSRAYMCGPYHRRNKWVVKKWIAPIRPRHVVEIAAGDPDMAGLVLKHVSSVKSYSVSDIDADLLEFMRRWLGKDKRATVSRTDANADEARLLASECDFLLCPSLEHFERDRELLSAAKSGTRIVFGAPTFGYRTESDCHLRQFDRFEQVLDRYGDIIAVNDAVWHGSGRRWVVLATRR